eukprot:1289795-Prorocentrum_lima.AAC.1
MIHDGRQFSCKVYNCGPALFDALGVLDSGGILSRWKSFGSIYKLGAPHGDGLRLITPSQSTAQQCNNLLLMFRISA